MQFCLKCFEVLKPQLVLRSFVSSLKIEVPRFTPVMAAGVGGLDYGTGEDGRWTTKEAMASCLSFILLISPVHLRRVDQ